MAAILAALRLAGGFVLRHWQLFAFLAVLTASYGWGYYDAHLAGKKAMTVAQAEWNAAEAQRAKVAAKAAADTLATERAGRDIAEGSNAALRTALDGANASAADLAHRLSGALAAAASARAGAVPRATGPGPAAEPAAREPAGSGEVEAAIAEYTAACARDSQRLSAWQTFYTDLRARYGRIDH